MLEKSMNVTKLRMLKLTNGVNRDNTIETEYLRISLD